MDPHIRKILTNYLGNDQPFQYINTSRYSTLVIALKECRGWTARDQYTGVIANHSNYGYPGHWLGAIGYFTILDQIGSCYNLIGNPKPKEKYNKIKFAIKTFASDLLDNNDKNIHALIALRNSLTHDFNLLNIPDNQNKKELEQHKFAVTCDRDNPEEVVSLRREQWNGDIPNKDFLNTEDTTTVNLLAFGNLVEKIHQRLIEKLDEGKIELLLDHHELINKYTFITTDIIL